MEEGILKLLRQDSFFLQRDHDHEVIVVDLTRHNRKPFVIKSMAFLLHPEAKSVLLVNNIFDRGRKTTMMSFSMSLGFDKGISAVKDLGEIMRTLNIGNGHAGAAGGVVAAESRKNSENKKRLLIHDIYELWKNQTAPVGINQT